MELRKEFYEFIRDRWTVATTTVSVPTIILIMANTWGKPDTLTLSIYVFIILFFASNSTYILLAQKEVPAVSLTVADSPRKWAIRYKQLRPFAWGGLIVSMALIPTFGLVPPFNAPFQRWAYGTPTAVPTQTPRPTFTVAPTHTPSPTLSPTVTLTQTPAPEADSLYYLFILDASSRMKASYQGSKTKWETIQSSALNHLIYGLPDGANFGLIELGGNLTDSTRTCDIKNRQAIRLGLQQYGPLVSAIRNLKPGGVASLGEAIKLARSIFDQKQGNIQKKLFMFLGGGDDCAEDPWIALKYFLKDYDKGTLIDVSTEVVILADEVIDPVVAEKLDELKADITRLGLENAVSLAAPQNESELQDTVAAIQDQTLDQASIYEPEAVDIQLTANAVQTAIQLTTATPTNTAVHLTTPSKTPAPIAATATSIPFFTPTNIPTQPQSRTPVPIQPTPTLPPPTTAAPPTFTPTLEPLVTTILAPQPEVFSPGCPLLADVREYAQFHQSQASIVASLVPSGYTNQGLRLAFSDVREDQWSYAGWEVRLGISDQTGIDLSGYTYLVFRIRGAAGGEEPNVWLMMPAADGLQRYWKDVEQVTPVTTEWQQVVIPLSHFTSSSQEQEQVKLTNIQKIQIIFEWYPQPRSGMIFIDDLCVQ